MRISRRLAIAAPLLLTAVFALIAKAQENAHHPLVVVITVDGFPARALKDPRLPMPNLRALIHDGAVSEGMIPINPSVTWPNHTTLITGVNASEHHVMANGLISFPATGGTPEVKPWVPKDELVHAQTLYDAAAEKGLTVGQVDWVAIFGAQHVTWQFGEKPDPAGVIPQELIHNNDVTQNELEQYGANSSPAWHDLIWTDAAVDILARHMPDLMLVHLLQTDSIQHNYGPLTSAAFEAYANADVCLGRIIAAAHEAAAKKTGDANNVTFFVLSDHGFASYTHSIHPNAFLKQQGLIQGSGKKATGLVWTQAEGGAAEVFIRDAAHRAELTAKLAKSFAGVLGVLQVYTNKQAQSLGMPALDKTDQAPDLYLTAQPDYAFTGEVDGPVNTDNPVRGQHGYDNRDPDMQALFVASGEKIRSGVTLPVFPNLRVAPTIARVMGVTLPEAKELPLDILR